MEVIGTSKCHKHKEEVNFMCSRFDCFKDRNILICKLCFPEHKEHPKDIIELSVLETGVKGLMSRRVEYEAEYEKACDRMIHQLKMFKAYKEDVTTRLNIRERSLNEYCRKIRRHMTYQKDQNFYKKNFGHIYLATRGLNQNLQLYKNFRKNLVDQIKQMSISIKRLESSLIEENHLLLQKDHQMCAILRKHPDYKLIEQPHYFQSHGAQFKKQTLTFKAKQEQSPNIYRIGDEQFLTFNTKHDIVRWYNTKSPIYPRLYPFKSPIQNLTMMGKYAFCSPTNGGMKIFDMLSQGVVKEYTSQNQKNAKIVDLQAVSSNSVLSFITNPNQIIHFRFDDEQKVLKTVLGIQTKNKSLKNIVLQSQFISSFDDLKLRSYNLETMQEQSIFKFENPVRAMCKMNQQTLMVGGQSNKLTMVDLRTERFINYMKIKGACSNVQKITNHSYIYTSGHSVRIFDSRNLKDSFEADIDDDFKHIKVLNSSLFVTSSGALHIWRMID